MQCRSLVPRNTRAGAIVIQAHPYRYHCYPLQPGLTDGIEVYNYSHNSEYNTEAEEYAAQYPEIILTSGADTHDADSVGFGGIATDERISDAQALIKVLRGGEYELIKP